MIITSVALIRAAAVWPFFSCISRTAPDVISDVMSCPPTDSVTWPTSPLTRTSTMRPTNWLRPLMRL